jgi:hypothetical protein
MPQEIISSYAKNKYGEVFYRMILAWRPKTVVEIGILHGYSTLHMALGIKKGKELGKCDGHIDAYDLFEDYPYKHGTMAEVQKMLEEEGVADLVTLKKGDAIETAKNYGRNSVWILHVDIGNTGEILRKIIEAWDEKLGYGCCILFEGGSAERDQEPWMLQYNKEPIKKELETNPIINKKYVYGTYIDWPSLTVLIKKTD